MPHSKVHQPGITLIAGIILIIVTLLAGVSVFMVMQKHAETLLSNGLQSSLESRVQLTKAEIEAGFDSTIIASNRPRMIDQLLLLNASTDTLASNRLNEIARSLVQGKLTAIVFYSKKGQELARSGVFSQQSELTVSISNLPGNVQLIWDEKLLLRAVVEIKTEGHVIGKVMTESSLPATMRAIKNVRSLGETGEQALCAPFGDKMQCFPTGLNPKIFTPAQRTAKGVRLPMTHAFEGETGFIITLDYRQQKVVAAYAPVGDLGLGMVLKMDRAELFAPVWQQLRFLIPLLASVLVIALVLLRWRVTPLVLKLVRSELEARQRSFVLTEEIIDANINMEHLKYAMEQHSIVSITDIQGNIIYTNNQFCEISQYTHDELYGKNHRILKSNIHPPSFFQDIWSTIAGGKAWSGEICNRAKDGSHYWVNSTIIPLLNEKGVPVKYISMRTDITKLKLMQTKNILLNTTLLSLTRNTTIDVGVRALAFQEICKATSQALDVGRVSIWHYNVDQQAIVCENLYEQGLDTHSSGLTLFEKDFPRYFAYIREERVLAAHDAHTDPATAEFSLVYLTPLGINSMLDLPVRFEGKLWGVVCIEHIGPQRTWSTEEQSFGVSIADFAARILSSEKILRINASLDIEKSKAMLNAKLASLGEMSAGIAHEINNPLAIIAGGLPMLTEFIDKPEMFVLKMNSIEKAILRITKIVKGLEKFSRSSEGAIYKVEILKDIIEEVLVLTGSHVKRHSVRVTTLCAEEGHSILCDVVEIEQVIINLINNAIDAVKNQPVKWIKINCFTEDQYIVLQVIDSGLVISEAIELKLFQPFFTTKRTGEGTGLGLSITKGILDEHKATIALNRSLPNTCFEIRFKKVEDIKNDV